MRLGVIRPSTCLCVEAAVVVIDRRGHAVRDGPAAAHTGCIRPLPSVCSVDAITVLWLTMYLE